MGKARDGSNCYTRQNKAGGKYITCEGQQKANRKLQREISKLHGRTRKAVTKDEFNEARAGLQQTLSNADVAERPGVVGMTTNWNRSDTVRGQSRRAAKARRLTTRPPGRIETGSLNPGSVITDFDTSQFVSEAPGVVGMTTNMTGLELATYDALMGLGEDAKSGILAAIEQRQREEKNWYILPITYLLGELYKKGMRDLRDTPLEGESRFGTGSTNDPGWSVVYKLAGNKMYNIRRVSLTSLRWQIRTDFIDPTELEDVYYEIDDIWNEPTDRVNEFLAEIGGAEPANDGSIDVSGIPHLRDLNLNTERWAAALGYTGEWSDNWKAGWKNVSWAKDGEELLSSLARKANKEYLDDNEPKFRAMKIKELKEQIPSYNRRGLKKKQDYIDYLLGRIPYPNDGASFSDFVTDPGRY